MRDRTDPSPGGMESGGPGGMFLCRFEQILNRLAPEVSVLLVPVEVVVGRGGETPADATLILDGARAVAARAAAGHAVVQGVAGGARQRRRRRQRVAEHGRQQVVLATLVDARRRPALTQVRRRRRPPHQQLVRRHGRLVGAARVRPQRATASHTRHFVASSRVLVVVVAAAAEHGLPLVADLRCTHSRVAPSTY